MRILAQGLFGANTNNITHHQFNCISMKTRLELHNVKNELDWITQADDLLVWPSFTDHRKFITALFVDKLLLNLQSNRPTSGNPA